MRRYINIKTIITESSRLQGLCEGFTIVELVVAMGIFAVVTAVAVGAFTQALRSERRLTSVMNVDSNASAALEQMAREIRTGFMFNPVRSDYAPASCSQDLSFIGPNGDVVYGLQGNAIVRGTSTLSSAVPITSGNVRVSRVCLLPVKISPCDPWRVVISMTVGSAQAADTSQDIQIQTTVSSRVLPREVPYQYKDSTIVNCH